MVGAVMASGFVALAGETNVTTLLTAEGKVEVTAAGTPLWRSARTNEMLEPGSRLRTGPRSRATLRLSDQTVLRVNELSVVEIRPTPGSGAKAELDLQSGSSYLFNRDRPMDLRFRTPQASGAIRGTEFHLEANAAAGRTRLALFDGEVTLANEQGEVILTAGEEGVVEAGQAPKKTAVLNALSIIQWCLYYPAVLNVEDLSLSDAEQQSLAPSLAAYRSGDLMRALAEYPSGRSPQSDADKIYHAALLLAVGQVGEAEAELGQLTEPKALAGALRQMIATVKQQATESAAPFATATAALAESYRLQSLRQLDAALQAARAATTQAPDFGFAWVRVAELEFSRGRIPEARAALERGLAIAPRNAQGLALQGFLLSAQNRTRQALESFEQAISIDGALGNAWLGRGLCRIRSGDRDAGRQDLQVAATLEPQRAILRSYLGKAWIETGSPALAHKELALARQLDPNDPTPWLYTALLEQEQNDLNNSVRDLEKSRELNDNRAVYRSRLLLDQDRAVRSANLASIYRDVGFIDVSAREAARAVHDDYGNYSAHLFLAESYDALRDPKMINLRYETPWFNELLLANLLAPVGAGSLSSTISQQEYARFFDGNHLGVSSGTEYWSRGDWLQYGSLYGTIGNTGYALDANYRSENGERPNNDLTQLSLSARVKQQLTPADSVYVEASYFESEGGDLAQYYDQSSASPTQREKEWQRPNLLFGYHHEWRPGIHTLFLGGRLDDTFELTGSSRIFNLVKNPAGNVIGGFRFRYPVNYRSDFDAYSAELQQIWQYAGHTVIAGGRVQDGTIDSQVSQPAVQNFESDLRRYTGYGYYFWQMCQPLQIFGGVSYDYLDYPVNVDLAPFTPGQQHKDQVSPKAGFYLTPLSDTTFRGSYTRSLGGLFYDTSVRLEPSQLAGFNQAFRSIIPESVVGLVPGSEFETFGLGLDQKFSTGTYLGVAGELMYSDADRVVGAFDLGIPTVPSGTPEVIHYRERSLAVYGNQLLGRCWSLGARYRLTAADLNEYFTALTPALTAATKADVSATLHQVNLDLNLHLPCGFFATADAIWLGQENRDYVPELPGDYFWQFNLYAGYRFLQRRAELMMGLLNLTDQEYHLNPLTLYQELPHSRTLVVSARFYF